MLNILISFILIFVSYSQRYPTFDQYAKRFNKKYTENEQNQRRSIYNENIKKFMDITQYQPGINNMTDWKEEQIQARANLRILDDRKNFTTRFPTNIVKVGNPLSLDWREKGVITPVRNQAECGACWAFATAAYAQSLLILQERFERNIDLSQKYLLDCTPLSYCSGGFLQYGMAVGLNMPLQKTYPFSQDEQYEGICSDKSISIAKYSNNYYNITDSQIITLLQQSPLAISIASKDWHRYGKGVFACPANATVDHAVLLVGYTPSYWIVKNQWGPAWGNDGYMHVTRVRQNNCRIGHSVHSMKQQGNRKNDNFFKQLISGQTINQPTNIIQKQHKIQKWQVSDKNKWLLIIYLVLLLINV